MQLSPSGKALINPRDYRSFCFRGEGRANFVISAKHRITDERIVWRFSKARKSGLMTVKARSELVSNYMERIVAPFFDEKFLVDMSIVEFDTMDVHHLAKIPSLPANQKIERFEDLFDLPSEYSFLPISTFQRVVGNSLITHQKRLTSLQMLDATQLPNSRLLDDYAASTITIEIKPKQGFFQDHPEVQVSHCNNCILQIEKCGSSHFSEMYDFCPLDLFSGNCARMRKAIHSLFLVPHRNLRLFVDGNLIHSDEKPLEEHNFDSTLFPRKNATTDDLISALCFVLSGNHTKKKFKLHKNSVLGQILSAQKIDEIGIVNAYRLYEKLDPTLQAGLLDKTLLARLGIDTILEKSNSNQNGLVRSGEEYEKLQQLRRYFVAATMKDCSVMISMRLLPPNRASQFPLSDVIRLPSGRCFAYSVKIVDLDPKTPKNLLNSYSRFLAGAKLIKLQMESSQANEGQQTNSNSNAEHKTAKSKNDRRSQKGRDRLTPCKG